MRRFDDLITHCSVFGAIQTEKAQIAPYSIFLTKTQKALNALNYSRKTHFNPLRIKNSSTPDNRQGIFLFILA